MSVMFWVEATLLFFFFFHCLLSFPQTIFFILLWIHIASLSCLWFLLLGVHSCNGEKHLCASGNPSAFRPREPWLCLSCFRRPFATCWESAPVQVRCFPACSQHLAEEEALRISSTPPDQVASLHLQNYSNIECGFKENLNIKHMCVWRQEEEHGEKHFRQSSQTSHFNLSIYCI